MFPPLSVRSLSFDSFKPSKQPNSFLSSIGVVREKESTFGMETLSNDLVITIFEFLEAIADFPYLSLVCKRFFHIIQTSKHLWHSLNFSYLTSQFIDSQQKKELENRDALEDFIVRCVVRFHPHVTKLNFAGIIGYALFTDIEIDKYISNHQYQNPHVKNIFSNDFHGHINQFNDNHHTTIGNNVEIIKENSNDDMDNNNDGIDHDMNDNDDNDDNDDDDDEIIFLTDESKMHSLKLKEKSEKNKRKVIDFFTRISPYCDTVQELNLSYCRLSASIFNNIGIYFCNLKHLYMVHCLMDNTVTYEVLKNTFIRLHGMKCNALKSVHIPMMISENSLIVSSHRQELQKILKSMGILFEFNEKKTAEQLQILQGVFNTIEGFIKKKIQEDSSKSHIFKALLEVAPSFRSSSLDEQYFTDSPVETLASLLAKKINIDQNDIAPILTDEIIMFLNPHLTPFFNFKRWVDEYRISPNLYSSSLLARCIEIAKRNGGYHEHLTFLLERGANPNWRNFFGETPLIVAIQKNRKKMIKSLIEYGADCSVISNDHEGALFYACRAGNLEIVHLLEHHGIATVLQKPYEAIQVDPDSSNAQLLKSIEAAYSKKRHEVVQYLISKHFGEEEALHVISSQCNIAMNDWEFYLKQCRPKQ